MNYTPVPTELQTKIRDAYRALMALTGGSRRRGQQEIIGSVASAVVNAATKEKPGTGARLLACQAPTGVGKTIAYVMGAVPAALAAGLKVVVSTGTVALQEQLFGRDLVPVQKVLPEMKAALIKGRNRFGCVIKIGEAKAQGGEFGALAGRLFADLESGVWSGDIDSLSERPADSAWSQLINDRNGCSGRKCSAYATCPFYVSRREVAQANVLVVSHALLLADVAADFNVLPKPEEAVWVIDEADMLPKLALGSLGQSHVLDDSTEFVVRCGSMLADVRKADPASVCGKLAMAAMGAIETMGGALSGAQMAISMLRMTPAVRDGSGSVRFKGGLLPEGLGDVAAVCRDAAAGAYEGLGRLIEAVQGEEGDGMLMSVREKLVADLGQALARVERVLSLWTMMAEANQSKRPNAKWLELEGNDGAVRVCASPIGVGDYLHQKLWSRAAASVHLSATLETVGGLAPYLRQSGLDRTPEVRTLTVTSPFDYARQATLVVPKGVCSPTQTVEHTKWLIDNIPAIIQKHGMGRGTLVLFTSFMQLRKVADAMPESMREWLLCQDRMPKRTILEKHSKAIAEGKSSVIFGTVTCAACLSSQSCPLRYPMTLFRKSSAIGSKPGA